MEKPSFPCVFIFSLSGLSEVLRPGRGDTDPEVIADVKTFVQLNKEYKELEPIVETSERYRTALANLSEATDVYALSLIHI